MRAVLAAHYGLINGIKKDSLLKNDRNKQEKNRELRYTKNSQFNDKIAQEFLKKNKYIDRKNLKYPKLINPFFY